LKARAEQQSNLTEKVRFNRESQIDSRQIRQRKKIQDTKRLGIRNQL